MALGEFPQPGCDVVLREVVKDRIWIERPAVVVAASAMELVIACPANSVMRFPAGLDDRRAFLTMWDQGEWQLATRLFRPPTMFRIVARDRSFDVWFCFNSAGAIDSWYVNLQAPIEIARDAIVTSDWILDICFPPDLSSFALKDEDELEMAVSLGIFTAQQGIKIRKLAHDICDQVLKGSPPWDVEWPARVADQAVRFG